MSTRQLPVNGTAFFKYHAYLPFTLSLHVQGIWWQVCLYLEQWSARTSEEATSGLCNCLRCGHCRKQTRMVKHSHHTNHGPTAVNLAKHFCALHHSLVPFTVIETSRACARGDLLAALVIALTEVTRSSLLGIFAAKPLHVHNS
jgi:hypothetical protein